MSEAWINVADAEMAAAGLLDAGPLGYFAGGAGDEVTLAENRAAWRHWRLLPRVLGGVGEVGTASELLAETVEMPVLVAPVAYQRLLDPEGELASARAAERCGTVFCLSTLATVRPSELAAAAPAGRHWFQLYCFRDRGVTRALTEEAAASGFEAVVVTVDAPPGGNRERDLRNGFALPAELGVPSVRAALGGDRELTIAETFALMEPALDWDDLEDLAAACGLPVLVKGVLSAEDATMAVSRGAAGVVVSNHGGRQLDCSVASAEALPEVVDAVGGQVPVLVDGGIRRGTDVAVALALGAEAVLVGRPVIWGLAAGGEEGALRVLEILREELRLTLGLCGCASPGELGRAQLRRAPAALLYSS